jgi:hypothetical protein
MDEEQRSDILRSFNKEQFIRENPTQISLSFLTVPKQFYGEVPYWENLTEESFFAQAKPESTAIKTASDLDQNSENKSRGSFQHYLEDVEQPVSKSPSLNFIEKAAVSSALVKLSGTFWGNLVNFEFYIWQLRCPAGPGILYMSPAGLG